MYRLFALPLVLAACGGASPEAAGSAEPQRRHLTGEVADLLERRCTSCHADTLAGPGGLSSRELVATHGLLTLDESMRFHRWMSGSAQSEVCTWGQHAAQAAPRERTGTHGFLRPGVRCAVCPFQSERPPTLEGPPQPVAVGARDPWI